MTLKEIIEAALLQLGRGVDAATIDVWKNKLTLFANDGMRDLATAFSLIRTESAKIIGTTIDLSKLDRICLKLLSITQDGFPLHYSANEAAGIVSVRGVGNVDVTYRYVPNILSALTDIPEIPSQLQGLIVTYVVARERMSGDKTTQSGADIYLQMYETAKARFVSATREAKYIENIY
ncbi:MAG: hypothetical protein GX802_08400 [Clostridiales bacterium]|jgi:hypothetical protein|nr:hypothetical protein [Clostridiales bacterium]